MIDQETFDAVRQRREEEARKKAEQDKFEDESEQRLIGKDATILGIQALVEYFENKSDGVTIKNHLESIGTPDVLKVVEKLEDVKKCIDEKEDVDLSPVIDVLNKLEVQLSTLPRVFPEQEQKEDVKVTNLSEIDTQSIVDAIKELDLKVDVKAPVVKVDAPEVNVEAQDLEPIKLGLQSVVEAVLGIKWPEIPETDVKGVESRLDKANEHLKKLVEKPIGGGGGGGSGTSFKTSTGNLTYVETESDGSIPVTVVAGGSATPNYATKIDTTSTTDNIYIGKAAIGSSGASAVWQIKKLNTATLALDKTWADGNDDFDNSWDNRVSIIYS